MLVNQHNYIIGQIVSVTVEEHFGLVEWMDEAGCRNVDQVTRAKALGLLIRMMGDDFCLVT